jgi:hypothetical protein
MTFRPFDRISTMSQDTPASLTVVLHVIDILDDLNGAWVAERGEAKVPY